MDNKVFIYHQFDDEIEETIPDSFVCCVCLDLLYKPIVLCCGHVSCFWCVHKSMNGFRESQCPICRHSYNHFPYVCEMLHFLLLKMYPLAYKRREKQVLEEEKRTANFSPQLDNEDFNRIGEFKTSQDACKISNMPSAPCEGKDCPSEDTMKSAVIDGISAVALDNDKTCSKVLRNYVLCPSCWQMLFRPAVLNCGHVFCETCIVVSDDEVIICKVCESPHPTDFPNVCLELNNFLEETFPKEYATRGQNVEHKQAQVRCKNPAAGSSSKNSAKKGFWIPHTGEHGSMIHVGVGCDDCGVCPIVGDRYQCQDCEERMGFDLCGNCYNTCSKRPGRFNQQHTPDHRFERLKESKLFQSLILEPHLDGFGDQVLAISAFESSSDGWIAIESAVLAAEGGDNVMHGNYTQNGRTSVESSDAEDISDLDMASPARHNDNTEQDRND